MYSKKFNWVAEGFSPSAHHTTPHAGPQGAVHSILNNHVSTPGLYTTGL